MRGTLTEGSLWGLLGMLQAGRRTGTLRLTVVEQSGGAPRVATRALLFAAGDLVGVESNVDSEALGPVLLRRGLLTTADLMSAGVKARETRQSLEWALEHLGLLGPERRRAALVEQLGDALVRLLGGSDAVYTFTESGAPAVEEPRLRLSEVMGPVLERLGRFELERALGDQGRALRPGVCPLSSDANALDRALVAAADGQTPARKMTAAVAAPPLDAQRRLLLLLSTGVLEPVERVAAPPPPPEPPRPPAARVTPPVTPPAPAESAQRVLLQQRRTEIVSAFAALPGATHFDVLGVSRDATQAEIKSAYSRLARDYHPDSRNDPALADVKDKVVAVFLAVSEAHQVLRDPSRRAAYEAQLGATPMEVEAPAPTPTQGAGPDPVEEYILRAHASLGRKDTDDAAQILEYVLKLPDVRADHRKAARVLLARTYRQDPKTSRDAERVLLEIVADEPASVAGYLALGNLYKDEGMRSRALRMFRKVAELDPAHRQAQEEIALLS
jgi:hypothetical protein